MRSVKAQLSYIYSWLRGREILVGFGLAIIVGMVAGLGSYAFNWLIQNIDHLFFDYGGRAFSFLGDYYIVIIPAIGGLIVGPLVYFFAREAKGHGVPEVMEAVTLRGGRIRPRVAAVKSLASAVCIGSGGSAGREGPIVQIGSSFGSTIGQMFKLSDDKVKTLVACGAAGGISATFNAPIAGVFFALEVILFRVVSPKFGYVVLSSVIANTVAHALMGHDRAFDVPQFGITSAWEIGLYAFLGIVAAFVALGFVKLLYGMEDLFEKFKFPEYLKPVIGGLAVGLLGLYSRNIFGVGYGAIDSVLHGEMIFGTIAALFVLKIVATSMTLGSGGSGGVFAPSLFIGAMLGTGMGIIFNNVFPGITAPAGAYGLVGMAAVFAGLARAPFAAILILFEMTGQYEIILPLMTAVVISHVVYKSIKTETIYTMKLIRRGVNLNRDENVDIMRSITVSEAMTRDFPTVSETMSLEDLLTAFDNTGYRGFPVLDDRGHLSGVVTLRDVEYHIEMGSNVNTVRDIAVRSPRTVYPDQSLHEILLYSEEDYAYIPVVSREDYSRLLGVLRRTDVIRAYRLRHGKQQ